MRFKSFYGWKERIMQKIIFMLIIAAVSSSKGLTKKEGRVRINFNQEIEAVSKDQFQEHMEVLKKTNQISAVTEGAFEFEKKFRSPRYDGKLQDVSLRLIHK